MLLLRVLGKTLLFIAFLALAYDGVRNLASPNRGLLFTSLSVCLNTYSPTAREGLARFFLDNGPSYFWTGVVEPILILPVSIVFSIFGTLMFLAGYSKPPPEIAGD